MVQKACRHYHLNSVPELHTCGRANTCSYCLPLCTLTKTLDLRSVLVIEGWMAKGALASI